ncbi:MAG: hypothetical protein ACRERC_07700 [Candidatus Binatia bacterium]
MADRETPRPASPALRCSHCGRAVRATQHTRADYAVDYYSQHGGRGEWTALSGELGGRTGSYVRLRDPVNVITCADCYRRDAVRGARDRQFCPEHDDDQPTDGA